MESISKEMLVRLPLAEAVLTLWRWVMNEQRLNGIWDRYRGRCFQMVITFPVMVQLIADALLRYRSGRKSFEKNIEAGSLEATVQAAYGKLGRLSIPLSEGLLAEVSQALREVFPDWSMWQMPASLQEFSAIIYDGKTIKHVTRRLKVLRGAPGGIVGGRALVAIDWSTGMAIAMQGDSDGDANEIKYLGAVVNQVRTRLSGPRLHLGDRAFGDCKHAAQFTKVPEDHFVLRLSGRTKFYPDRERPARRGQDERGRPFTESWGWLGSPSQRQPRKYVRCIELPLSDNETLVLITDLLDADWYPASDLLWMYAQRWDIERMFQTVTEVFELKQLIGSTPQAGVFQFAFCLVLYNMIQVVRGYVAEAQNREPSEISTEKLFGDVREQLTAWNVMIDPTQTTAYFADLPTPAKLRDRLRCLLSSTWSKYWLASPPQTVHRITPRQKARTHHSVQRLINAQKTPAKAKNSQGP